MKAINIGYAIKMWKAVNRTELIDYDSDRDTRRKGSDLYLLGDCSLS